MRVASKKPRTAFAMQNIQNSGASGGGVTIFHVKKAHPWLIPRILSHYACKSVRGFSSRLAHEKKVHYKKSQGLYFTYLRRIPNSSKFN